MQLVMIKLWQALEQVCPATCDEFRRLAMVQTERVLVDWARHFCGPDGLATNTVRLEISHALIGVGDGDSNNQQPYLWAALHDAMAALPDDERMIVGLRCYDGRKFVDIAKELGVSIDTVRRRWKRAREYLRRCLGDEARHGG